MRKILLPFFAALGLSWPAHSTCEVGQLLEFKVTMRGPQPIADIGINGRTLPFIIDSGAFFSNISPGTAQELGLRLETSPVTVSGVGGEARRTYLTYVKTLDLAGVPIHDVQFLVAGSEVGAAGLIGQNILGIGDAEYDLGHGIIRIMRSKGCSRDDNLAYWAGQTPVSEVAVAPRDFAHSHTIGSIRVNGAVIRVVFDTGAGSSILSLQAAKRAGITPSSPGVVPAGLSGGVGRSMIQNWIAPVASITIGTEEARNVKVRIGDINLPNADMLIGTDFFLSHRVYVANGLQKLYFTYNGGPVFNVTPSRVVDEAGATRTLAADTSPEPTDADGFSRRGAADMARGDYKVAIADLDHAVKLEPANGHYLFQRAQAEFRNRDATTGFADLDKAAELAPGDAEIRLAHAESLLLRKRKDDALKDLEAANVTLPAPANERLTLAGLFDRLDRFDRAIANYDQWIQAHPDDSRQMMALNGRCWARALSGRDLPLALKDCNAALRRGKSASFFDSRGLVELRMGQYDQAIADYTQALLLAPRSAWSLYGRGLAWRHKNNPSAQQDLDAAASIDPALPAHAKELGIN